MQDLWVFGYGSLMWNPGFAFAEQAPARLAGWHRALCIYSTVHRGTPEAPGLVLGLDRGGSCRGLAFRVEPANRGAVIDYLREREQVTAVYREIHRPVRLDDGSGRVVEAVTYVADRGHPQYAGRLDEDEVHRLVSRSRGKSGINPDYVLATARHLVGLGIADPTLARLAARLEREQATPVVEHDDVE